MLYGCNTGIFGGRNAHALWEADAYLLSLPSYPLLFENTRLMGNMFQVNLFTHDKTLFKQVFSDGCSEKPAPLRKTSRISLNEALSACRRAPAPAIATCSFHPDPPNWSDAQTALPVTLTDCQEQRPTSREIVPSNDEEPSLPAVRSAHAQLRATMFGISHARKEKGKIRPVGTISRDVMRTRCVRQMLICFLPHHTPCSSRKQG